MPIVILNGTIDGKNYCDYGTEPGEQVSVARVKRLPRPVVESRQQRRLHMPRRAFNYLSIRIDYSCHTVIGSNQYPAIVFNGAHPGHIQVLPGSAGIAIPAIIGNINQNVRALLYKRAYCVGENRLVPYEHSVAMTVRRKYHPVFSRCHMAHLVRQRSCKGQQLWERRVFAKRDQMHLVVATNKHSIWGNKCGGVKHRSLC